MVVIQLRAFNAVADRPGAAVHGGSAPLPLQSIAARPLDKPPQACRYYDLEELRREHGWVSGYTDPKPGRYHAGCRAGDLSQTGQVGGGEPKRPTAGLLGRVMYGRAVHSTRCIPVHAAS